MNSLERSVYQDSLEAVRNETPFVPILGVPHKTISLRVSVTPIVVDVDKYAYFRVSNAGTAVASFSTRDAVPFPSVAGDIADCGVVLNPTSQSMIYYAGGVKQIIFQATTSNALMTLELWTA